MSSKKPEIRKNKFSGIYFIFIGVFLIFIALAIPVSTFVPVFKAEINYQFIQIKSKPTEIIPIDTEFSIIIPKINANTKVIKNVNPFDSKIYQRALTNGVAHASGSATPDEPGNIFIFAHSAGNWYQANQFNAVFYLLNKLEMGDEIVVFYKSKKYIYSVDEKKLINGSETSYMQNNSNKNQLTLMTCWPPGTTLKRLIVIASPKND